MSQIAQNSRINQLASLCWRAGWVLALIAIVDLGLAALANAQQPPSSDFFRLQTPATTAQAMPPHLAQLQAPAATPPALYAPTFGNPTFQTSPPITLTPPSTTLQFPPVTPNNGIDPFRQGNTAFPIAPSGNSLIGQQPNNFNFLPPQQPQQQVFVPNQYPYANPGYSSNQYQNNFPNQGYPNQGGDGWWPASNNAWPSQMWTRLRSDVLPRLLERPRFRETWIHGNNGNELGLNQIELATTMTFANWLRSNQALRLTPGFTFFFWDGPDTAITGFDLPARTYSAFLSSDYISNPNMNAGIETSLTVGVYSDFDNVSSDSLRVTGVGLGWLRVNSYTTAKLGVEYFDRIGVKMLPAAGIFLAPNQDLKLDVYFPRPKLAQRLPNWQNMEAWAYVGGEYGGGSWTIMRMGGMEDQVDVNDVRGFIGVEWMGTRRVTGFAEIGYLFNREMIYRSDPTTKLELQDALMVRMGLSF